MNDAIDAGIKSYLLKLENPDSSVVHYFEYVIIDFLIHLYGKINIINPYQLKSEDSLKNNLIVYGASKEQIDDLFILLDEYNNWIKSNSKEKNNILEAIFKILSGLVILKRNSVGISDEEMAYYENFFNLRDNKIRTLAEMMSNNKEDILSIWPRTVQKKEEAKEEKKESLFLAKEEYEKHGLEMEEVENLPEDRIKAINAEILRRDKNENQGGSSNEKPWQLVLSSGNGFIDALVLLSIMCTEIMIGVIITIILARL